MTGKSSKLRTGESDAARRRFMQTVAATGGAVLLAGSVEAGTKAAVRGRLPAGAAGIVRRYGGEFGELGKND